MRPTRGGKGDVSGWPNSDWYQWRLPGTSRTPIIVHVRLDVPVTSEAEFNFVRAPHVNPNTGTEEFSLRDPDGYLSQGRMGRRVSPACGYTKVYNGIQNPPVTVANQRH